MITLGTDINTGEGVTLSDAARVNGTYAIGLNGTGKSTLLGGISVQDMATGKGLCLVDAHGPLLESVVTNVPADREGEVVLLDATDEERPFGLNIFDPVNAPERMRSRYTAVVTEGFRKAFGQFYWGVQIQAMMQNITTVFLEHPGMTLADIPRFLDDFDMRQRMVSAVPNETVRIWWQRFEKHAPREKFEYTDPIFNRLTALLSDPLLARIVSARQSTVNFPEAIRDGQIILVNLPAGVLGDPAVSLLGTVVVGQFLLAAMGGAALHLLAPFTLLCDEYQRFDTEDFATIFDEMRKGNIGLIVGHQRRSQLDTEKRRSAPLGARNRIVFQVTGADAQELAGEFDHTPPPAEIVGYKASRSLSTDPWAYFEHHTHGDPSVQALVVKLKEAIREYHNFYYMNMPPQTHPIQPLMTLINQEIASAMWYGTDAGRYWQLRAHLRVTEDEMLPPKPYHMDPPYASGLQYSRSAPLHALADTVMEIIWDLGDALYNDPVYTMNEGQEPQYGTQRTYADMENEITTELTRLPSYTAKVRILENGTPVEYMIRTRPLAAYVTYATADAEAIREESRARYGQRPSGDQPPLGVPARPKPPDDGGAGGGEETFNDTPGPQRTTRRRVVIRPPESP